MRSHTELVHVCIWEDFGAGGEEMFNDGGVEGRVVGCQGGGCGGGRDDGRADGDVGFQADEFVFQWGGRGHWIIVEIR